MYNLVNLTPFDFSKSINKINIYQHLCYYYNEANNNMNIIDENKKLALLNFKELYYMLRQEYKEYIKVKNRKSIYSSKLYAQYVDNITNACIKPIGVNSYKMLNSNLYDIQDYATTGFENIFYIEKENSFDGSNIENFLGKTCCIRLKNYNVFVGKVDISLYDNENNINESISVLFLDNWHQIKIGDIEKIKIIEE